jgi:DNA polymerase-3 subunit gamma/tau
MPYEVLARKWRPQVFQEVIGQDHVTQTLVNAITSERLAHAYLFSGPRGVGKTSVARILAKAINCEQGEPGIPCNKCHSCEEITDGSSVDVQEIDGASNRGIDEIRELRENTKYMPSSSKYRIYIIDEVHMLTKEAFNALLKTLEEPPAHVKFIFATTEPHKVPMTILSRCQKFDFKRIPISTVVGHLEKISKEEGFQISSSGLYLIARGSEGSMRDAESLLDQVVSFTGPEVEDRHVVDILGILDRELVFRASEAIIDGRPKDCLEITDKIYNYGHDLKEFYRALMEQFRDLLVSLIVSEVDLLDMTESERLETRKLAGKAGQDKLQVIVDFLIRREEDLRFSSNPRLILETIMIKLCHLDDHLSFDDLLEKIESLEQRLLSGLPSTGTSHGGEISEPDAGWNSEPPKGVESVAQSGRENGKTWEDFLAFLSTRNKTVRNILMDWELVGLTEDVLEIARGSRSFSSTYFDDKERYAQLVEFCQEFFNKDIKIRLVDGNPASPETRQSSGAEPSEPQSLQPTDLPPHVQDILHMFQGEIKEVSPTEDGGRHHPQGQGAKEEVHK